MRKQVLSLGLVLCCIISPAWSATAVKERSHAEEVQQVFDYLLKEYAHIWDSPDWLTRCLASLSMARLPLPQATNALLGDVEGDKFPVVSLVSWECSLARARYMDQKQIERFLAATQSLQKKNVFLGNLRLDLLHVMAVAPADKMWQESFLKLFSTTNSMSPQDILVLREMGKVLATWKSADLANTLIEKFKTINDAYRAEYILHYAGFNVNWAVDRLDKSSLEMWSAAYRDYKDWLNGRRSSWTGKKQISEWRKLQSSVLSVDLWDMKTVNIEDSKFRNQEMEIRKPRFKLLELALVVDATGSMRPPMDWLAKDMSKMTTVLGLLANKAQVSYTWYRDYDAFSNGVCRTNPFTANALTISDLLQRTAAQGGEDYPEAVYEGLASCIKFSGWSTERDHPRIIILVGDAPPHYNTQSQCEALLRQKASEGFKFFAVKVLTPKAEKEKPASDKGDVPAFDALAKAANGRALLIDFLRDEDEQLVFYGKKPDAEDTFKLKFVRIAEPPDRTPPSHELLKSIMADAVNEQYRDRIRPLIPIFLAASEQLSPKEYRSDFPGKLPPKITPPPKPKGGAHKGGHKGRGGRGGGGGGGGGGGAPAGPSQ